jgi:hypothetical protein
MTRNFWEQIKKGAASFAKKREKEGGGFGATPLLPRTVEDTYFGLAILDPCQALDEISKAKHLSYLSTISWQELLPETLLYYLKALSLLNGARPNSKELEKYLDDFLAKATSVKRLAILFSIAQTLDLTEPLSCRALARHPSRIAQTLDPQEQSERFSLKEVKERIAQEILRILPKEEKLTLELLYYLLLVLPEFVKKKFKFCDHLSKSGWGIWFYAWDDLVYGKHLLWYKHSLLF